MKNLGLTLLMMLFVGVGTSLAQDKKAATKEKASVKTEKAAANHKCAPGCTKACCAKKEDGKASATPEKKACAPGCQKACCTADAGKAKTKDEHEGHDHPKKE